MGKPILYEFQYSSAVRAVWLVARAIDLDLEHRVVNIRIGEQNTPEYLQMNPQHKVPTLDDNGFYLPDSHAISTYLIGRYATDDSLYPKELQIRARIDQRLHFDSGILFPPLADSFVSVIYEGAFEFKQATLAAIESAYEVLDRFLDGQQYLVGNSITVADFSCITSVTQLEVVLPIDPKFANVRAWIRRVAELPYYNELNGTVVAELKEWIDAKMAENRAKCNAGRVAV